MPSFFIAALGQAELPEGVDTQVAAILGLILVTLACWFYGWVFLTVSRSGRQKVSVESFGPAELAVGLIWCALFFVLAWQSQSLAETNETTDPAAMALGGMLTVMVVQLVIFAVPLTVICWRGYDPLHVLGMNKIGFLPSLGWSMVFLLAVYPVLGLISSLLYQIYGGRPDPQPVLEMIKQAPNAESQIVMIAMAIIIAPICEEFVYRGFLYPALKRYVGLTMAMLLSALLFGLAHMHAPAVLPLMFLGIILVLAYEFTGSLIVPMTIHALFNAATLAMLHFIPELR
ncbi:MAG: lysostaphin resistance A-like protein [Verrucomicrobiales bacterium]